jgi:hypothetical protein
MSKRKIKPVTGGNRSWSSLSAAISAIRQNPDAANGASTVIDTETLNQFDLLGGRVHFVTESQLKNFVQIVGVSIFYAKIRQEDALVAQLYQRTQSLGESFSDLVAEDLTRRVMVMQTVVDAEDGPVESK